MPSLHRLGIRISPFCGTDGHIYPADKADGLEVDASSGASDRAPRVITAEFDVRHTYGNM